MAKVRPFPSWTQVSFPKVIKCPKEDLKKPIIEPKGDWKQTFGPANIENSFLWSVHHLERRKGICKYWHSGPFLVSRHHLTHLKNLLYSCFCWPTFCLWQNILENFWWMLKTITFNQQNNAWKRIQTLIFKNWLSSPEWNIVWSIQSPCILERTSLRLWSNFKTIFFYPSFLDVPSWVSRIPIP